MSFRRRVAATLSALAAVAGLALPGLLRAQGTSTGQGRHMMWTVSRGETTVYLLGSIHVLSPDVYPLPAVLDSAFTDAERVVFEADLDSLMQRGGELLMRATFAEGRTLKSELSPATYALLEEKLTGFGVPIAQLQRFEPWFVGMMLTQLSAQKAGLKAEYGIDMHFKTRAQQAGKALGALESVDFQLGLFDGLAPSDQDAFLRSSLAGIDTAAKTFEAMKAAWRSGNGAALDRMMHESMAKYPRVYAAMLTDRNLRWLPQIEAMLQGRDDVLVVVGSAHLVGKDGVVEMLRAKGYTVTQR